MVNSERITGVAYFKIGYCPRMNVEGQKNYCCLGSQTLGKNSNQTQSTSG